MASLEYKNSKSRNYKYESTETKSKPSTRKHEIY